MSSRIALVGGGRGFIGRSLCKALEKDGYSVKVISRTQQNGSITWKEIEDNGFPRGTTAVFNLAGELVLNPLKRWNKTLEDEIYNSRIKTTRILRDVIESGDVTPEFWGSCSGVGYYPPHPDNEYNEDSEVLQRDYWSKLTMHWEEAAQLTTTDDVRHVIMRTGVVIGPKGGALQSMYPAFFMGAGGPVGSGQQWFPWVHLDDVVGIWMHALRTDTVHGVLNGVSPQHVTNKQFATTFGQVLRRPAILPLPAFAVRMMFGATRASMLLEGQKVEPRRTLQSGYKFIYPDIHSALEASI